jgi:Vps54-like protein
VTGCLYPPVEEPEHHNTASRRRVGVDSVHRPQVFNSRMCQLVLGAGAMATAGLRSITAKHLALSAQAAGAHAHCLWLHMLQWQMKIIRE